jgi:hypothetical protein
MRDCSTRRWSSSRAAAASAVPAGAAQLLVVGVQGLGRVGVEHEADVRLVDPHSEGGGGDDHRVPVGHERLLGGPAVGRPEPGMVGHRGRPGAGQPLGQRLGPGPGGGVHDPGPVLAGRDPLDQGGVLGVGVGEPLDGQADVGAVEAAHHDRRVAQAEALGDLAADGRGRGGGQGQRPRPPQGLQHRPQPSVLGPEVVAPGADAVGLVHHQQRRLGGDDMVEGVGVGQLLGGQEQELQVALGEVLDGLAPLAGPQPPEAERRAGQRAAATAGAGGGGPSRRRSPGPGCGRAGPPWPPGPGRGRGRRCRPAAGRCSGRGR